MTDLHNTPAPAPPSSDPSYQPPASGDQGSGLAANAADAAKQTASATADAGSQVTGAAADGAREVASQVSDQVTGVTKEASDQARQLAEKAQQQAREQASSQTQRAATTLRDLGKQVRGMTEGQPAESDVAKDAARALADKIESLGQRLEERGFDGTVEDVRDFARRKPGLFLLGAAATGFVVTRLGRGLQAANQQEQEQDQMQVPGPYPVTGAGIAPPFPTAGLGEPSPPTLPAAGTAAPIPAQPASPPPMTPPLGGI